MLNRTAGGIGSYETYTDTESSTLLAIVANKKTRNLLDFVDSDKLKSIVSEDSFKYYLEKYPMLRR